MEKVRKALSLLLIPFFINIAVVFFLAQSGTKSQFAGFASGAGIVLLFSLIWIGSINRIRRSNVVTFIKSFIFIFIAKFGILILTLFLSLDILGNDRIYFVLGFVVTTVLTLPIEIWLSLQKEKKDVGI